MLIKINDNKLLFKKFKELFSKEKFYFFLKIINQKKKKNK